MLFNLANLPYWIFLTAGILLFLLMIFSGGSDQELEVDADIDLEIETEAEFDSDVSGDFGFGQILSWAGIGKIPLMLLLAIDLSLWGLIGWMLNVWLSRIFAFNNIFAALVLFISLIISLWIGKLIAQPISKIFAEFGEDASSDRLIGCIGTVTSVYIPSVQENKIGQVDVLDAKRNLLTITAVLPNWATIAPQRGDKVIVIDRQESIYLVIAKNSVDQEKWFNQSHQK